MRLQHRTHAPDLYDLYDIEALLRAAVYLGSERKNAATKDLLGLPTANRVDFEFRWSLRSQVRLPRPVDNFCAKPLDF